MRISDWSSDVCSSDLAEVNSTLQEHGIAQSDVESAKLLRRSPGKSPSSYTYDVQVRLKSCTAGAVVFHMTKYCMEIGRASGREGCGRKCRSRWASYH